MCMESESWSDIQRDAEHVNLPPVQFIDINDKYSVQNDLQIVVEFGKKFVATIDDWIGLFPLGWRTLKQYVAYQWIEQEALNGKQVINIDRTKLPTDLDQYYQFMYVNGNTTVIGISAPFYFTTEEIYMDAQCGEELRQELRRLETSDSTRPETQTTESKIEMIPEESYTSIMADTNFLYDSDTSIFCETVNSDSKLRESTKNSRGDNPEFQDTLETMALVPWTSQELVSEPEKPSKPNRKSRRDKPEMPKTEAIPLDEKGLAHVPPSSESVVPPTEDAQKDAHLDQVVSRFFNFLGSVIVKSESEKSVGGDEQSGCARCSQLESDVESVKSRAIHAEYRETALVRELSSLRKQVKQQELRTSELLDHLQVRCDDGNVEILKNQLTQVLNELQQAAHAIHRLTRDKTNLEAKVGNLMWEKAGLCAKLQVLQQGEARNSRRTSDLSAALVEAREEIRRSNRRSTDNERLVEALLSTLSSLGFVNVKDLSGNLINLENVTGPTLDLEPVFDDNCGNLWTKKKFPDNWYKAVMTSQEVIHELRAKIDNLEAFCRDRDASMDRLGEMHKVLTDERKKSKLLENQMSQMVMTFAPNTYEKNFLIQERIDSGYELQGARPKFVGRTQLCEPVDQVQKFRATTAPSVDNFPQSCPYCAETFPAYLLPNDKEEHIRMHMYSELQRNNSNLNNQNEF